MAEVDGTVRMWISRSVAPIAFAALLLAAVFAAPVTARSGDQATDRYIVVLKNTVEHPAELARQQVEARDGDLSHIYTAAINGYAAELTPAQAAALENNPKVKYVETDDPVELYAQTMPTGIERAFATQNPVPDIDGVDDVRVNADVAVIDTGMDFGHPDLNVYAKSTPSATYAFVNCLEAEPSDENPENDDCKQEVAKDGYGHGTHVSGIIGAIDNDFGAVGIAPGVRLWSAKVFTDTGGTGPTGFESAVLGALNWVYEHADQIEAVNMSLGGPGEVKAWQEAIAKGVDAGVVFIAAAGNENIDASNRSPAKFDEVITVSALSDYDGKPGGLTPQPSSCDPSVSRGGDDTLATYSNWGAVVDVAAPGTCIYSTMPVEGSLLGKNYKLLTGTSMAAPYVAGAAAIFASESNPNSKAGVEAIRQKILGEGSLNWEDNSGDGVQEPLLDLRPVAAEAATLPASALETNSARLNAVVSAGGLSATYKFEYGTTTSYGSSVPASPEGIGSGINDLKVSKSINVEPDVTFHYRVAVTNSKGTFYGGDRIFVTSRWSQQSIPSPSGEEVDGELFDVSCASAINCVAVGQKSTPAGIRTFAERWNGSQWSIMATVNPTLSAGESATLESVSCPSLVSCVAIGTAKNAPFSEYWDGSKWTLAGMPSPGGALSPPKLPDVSCIAATNCMAVGQYVAAKIGTLPSEEKTLTERWNGSTWSIVASPNPEGFKLSSLGSISCSTSVQCMAVGATRTEQFKNPVPLVLNWTGSSWSVGAAPVVPGGNGSVKDVACLSSTFCMAVGSTSGVSTGYTTSWNGTAWQALSSGMSPTWGGISCTSESSCRLIGEVQQAKRWNGSEWLTEDPVLPLGATQLQLRGIACSAPEVCTAVGKYLGSRAMPGTQPLAERLTPTPQVKFRADEYPTALTGIQTGTHTITLLAGHKLTCSKVTMSGVIGEASSMVNLTPAYSSCGVSYGQLATVNPKSCSYMFYGAASGKMEIVCSKEGDAIEIKTTTCVLTIPPQAALGSVQFTNTGTRSRGRTITATLNVAGLKYTETSKPWCPAPGTYEGGAYTGTSVIKGYNQGAEHAVGVYMANEEVASPPLFEGEQYPMNVQAQQTGSSGVHLPNWEASFTCSTMTGISKWDSSATEINQKIKAWEGCPSLGKINMNSCSFTLRGLTSEPFPFEAPKGIVADGSMGIACSTGGDAIKFKVLGGCEVQIPAQDGLDGVHLENSGSGKSRTVKADFDLEDVTYTEGSGCPAQGTHEDGALFGEWTLKGYDYIGAELLGEQEGIWVE